MAPAAVGHRYRGKLTPAQGNYIFAIVTVEYFTKWVEAKPVTNIASATIQNFFPVEHHLPLWSSSANHR
jgi:hypothetical protein